MLNRKKVLGKGLGALITDARAPGSTDKFQLCHVSRIVPNRMQPRRRFDDPSLKLLSDSIREKGIIEPLIVRRSSGGFELIAGERRLRAAKMVGLDEVPVVVMDATDEESLELSIIENIQRENLNAMEEGEAYRSLMNFGLSQEEVAKKVGKDRATVANYLRLLKLPPEVKEELIKGTISMGHARAILSLDSHMAQTELCAKIVRRGLSVREAEEFAQTRNTRAPRKTRARGPMVSLLEDELRMRFGTKVLIKENNGKGRIEIHYYSAEDRERVLELLQTTQ